MGPFSARTQRVEKTLNPVWTNEEHLFVLQEEALKYAVLTAQVWDWNRIKRHQFLGQTAVPLTEFLPLGRTPAPGTDLEYDNWYDLEGRSAKDKVSGSLHLRMRMLFTPAPDQAPASALATTRTRANAMNPTSLADLQAESRLGISYMNAVPNVGRTGTWAGLILSITVVEGADLLSNDSQKILEPCRFWPDMALQTESFLTPPQPSRRERQGGPEKMCNARD